MKGSRTMADIAREGQVAEQNMQHFMSHSPWSGRALIEQVQHAVCERPELQGGLFILDESADEKSGDGSAGAGRQHNGRMGKVDESQVGVYLAYAKNQHWTLWDGGLFRGLDSACRPSVASVSQHPFKMPHNWRWY